MMSNITDELPKMDFKSLLNMIQQLRTENQELKQEITTLKVDKSIKEAKAVMEISRKSDTKHAKIQDISMETKAPISTDVPEEAKTAPPKLPTPEPIKKTAEKVSRKKAPPMMLECNDQWKDIHE